MTNFEWKLMPSKFDEKSRAHVVQLSEWNTALRLSREFGYAAPEASGMTRDAVRCFAQALRAAVRAGRVPEADTEWVGHLIRFLETDASGGFTQARQWKDWRRVLAGK